MIATLAKVATTALCALTGTPPSGIPPPDLSIPSSSNTVSVSIINTTTLVNGIASTQFFGPQAPGLKYLSAPAYSFLIQHPQLHRNLVFDLAIRKDIENLSPFLLDEIKNVFGAQVKVEKDVKDILEEGGFDTNTLEAVVWSHWHFDHVGNPATFAPHTALIVGPGFKDKVAPGYPANPNSTFLEADYAGRELREISFKDGEPGVGLIGRFRSFDYFGDGSFYLLDAPGHAIGHLNALARVTSNPDSFVLMAADSCHHGGEIRPSQYLPLPPNIEPNPFTSVSAPTAPCPGSLFEKLLRDGNKSQPFFVPVSNGSHYDAELASKTIEKIQEADAHSNVLVAMAHDQTLESVVEFFPKTANDFVQKGWVAKLRWLFLRDLAKAVGYQGVVEGHNADWITWNG